MDINRRWNVIDAILLNTMMHARDEYDWKSLENGFVIARTAQSSRTFDCHCRKSKERVKTDDSLHRRMKFLSLSCLCLGYKSISRTLTKVFLFEKVFSSILS